MNRFYLYLVHREDLNYFLGNDGRAGGEVQLRWGGDFPDMELVNTGLLGCGLFDREQVLSHQPYLQWIELEPRLPRP